MLRVAGQVRNWCRLLGQANVNKCVTWPFPMCCEKKITSIETKHVSYIFWNLEHTLLSLVLFDSTGWLFTRYSKTCPPNVHCEDRSLKIRDGFSSLIISVRVCAESKSRFASKFEIYTSACPLARKRVPPPLPTDFGTRTVVRFSISQTWRAAVFTPALQDQQLLFRNRKELKVNC